MDQYKSLNHYKSLQVTPTTTVNFIQGGFSNWSHPKINKFFVVSNEIVQEVLGILFLADPGKARGCSTNTSVTH